ncbi:uncharacterized protein TNIN_250961 [Trichonephila inaurata madagascariensis]|uniref:Mutator-like transposase domain-containing protein n=1 Tax=Trichonephila inaurata madagascariensis TaxID=2747483 RepID=A0A8X6XRT0_9ARAC|nr:uncharacterized protein TNIN_250961 [Trichonephila inaurata madagascariensis]
MNSKRMRYEECTPVSTNTNSKTCLPSTSNSRLIEPHLLSGRRIVNISYFMSQIQIMNNHSPFECSFSNMKIMSEVRKGLNSGIRMKCEMCHFQEMVWTEDPDNEKMPVNTAAVSGVMKIGGGFANLEELLSTLDIPPLSSKTDQKEHNTIATAWEKVAEKEMYRAAMEEKQLAVQAAMAENGRYVMGGLFILFLAFSAREIFSGNTGNDASFVKEIPKTSFKSAITGPTLKFLYCFS